MALDVVYNFIAHESVLKKVIPYHLFVSAVGFFFFQNRSVIPVTFYIIINWEIIYSRIKRYEKNSVFA